MLRTLTEADLKELGLSLGDRKRLLQAVAAMAVVTARRRTPAPPPAPTAPPAEASPAERRQLTVMFVDLVGSTALSQRLDPEEMRDVLQDYQNMVAGEIGRFEGFVAKLMGDGVLAYFGWPRAREDEPERAVRAGLAVVAAVRRLPRVAGQLLAARVGIATGLVVVGDLVGEGAAQEQAVVGDTPNLAARLQALAEPGMVVIGEATRRLIGDLFVLRDLGGQVLKGIREPAAAFVVEGERAVESRFAARQGGTMALAPIVGRDQELALLLERWRQAGSGEGQVVLLTGEAGIGKSHITEALIQRVAAEPHFLLRYQCSPYHTDSALYPVIQQLSFAAGLAAEEDLARRLDRLEAVLARATDDVGEAAPLLAALVGLDGAARYGAPAMGAQQRRARTLAILVQQLTGLARRRPVLWVVEDAHWVDPTTLELIEAGLDAIQGTRVLALITARPTFTPAFASHPVVTRVALNRLARAAMQAIVARITRGKALPDALLDEIAARTDGVPLFVEEMTKAVLESGALQETGESYRLAGPLSHLAIPTTLHDSLMARLDRLQPVKMVAQTAAVIGRSFDHATIAALSGMPEVQLAEAMRKLVEAELVFRRGVPPDATYLFKHALVRDAAYESMLKSRRQALHLRLVDILEAGGTTPPELLAQHAQAAGAAGRAIAWWREAGEAAVGRAAFEEAAAHLDAAQALLPALEDATRRKREEAVIATARAHASLVSRGYAHDETRALYARADALAEAADDPRLLMPARYGLWVYYHVREEVGPALAMLEQFRTVAARWDDPQLTMMLYRLLATSQTMGGRLLEARESAGRARALYVPARDEALSVSTGTNPLVSINSYSSLTELALGFPDRARLEADVAREIWLQSELVNTRAYGMWHRAVLLVLAGDAAEAGTLAAELVAYAGQRGLPFWEGIAQVVLAWSRLGLGDAASAAAAMPAALRAAETSGSGLFGSLARSVLGEALAVLGDPAGLRAIDDAMALAAQSGAVYALPEIQRRRGVVLRRLRPDAPDAAEAAFAGRWRPRDRSRPASGNCARPPLAQLMAEQGRRSEALELLAPVCAGFTEGFGSGDLAAATALVERLRALTGRVSRRGFRSRGGAPAASSTAARSRGRAARTRLRRAVPRRQARPIWRTGASAASGRVTTRVPARIPRRAPAPAAA
ncbi:MAG: adenylate/guanylate cyclase domain-containing protein [Dongiaceae bacterium]